MAVAAARSEYAKRKRDDVKLSITMPGRHDLLAEAPLILVGWEDDVETTWLIKRVRHSLSGGWQCSVEAELPDDAEAVKSVDIVT